MKQQIYQFIITYTNREQLPRTIREISQALGIKRISHINYHLVVLEKKGFIKQRTRKSCGINLIKPQAGIPIGGAIVAGAPIDIFPDIPKLCC